MKKIYIAHPLRGRDASNVTQVCRNKLSVDEICQRLAIEHPELLLLSPVHAFSFAPVMGPQQWVFSQCQNMLALADELWVFGDWESSEGCRMEIAHARAMGLPVVFEDGHIEGGAKEEVPTA